MSFWRGTVFFTQFRDGWSETYFLYDQTQSSTEALLKMRQLIKVRKNLLAKQAFVNYCRVSDDLIPGDSRVESYEDVQFTNPDLSPNAPAFTALQLRMEANQFTRRMLYLRGLPEAVVGEAGTFLPDAKYQALLSAYIKAVTNGTFAIKGILKPLVNRPLATFVINPLNAHRVDLTTTDALGGIVGQKVMVSGWPRKTGWNGTATIVQAVNNTTYQIERSKLYGSGFAPLPAFIALKNIALPPITNVVVRRTTHRIQGRPFGQHRGRSRARQVA